MSEYGKLIMETFGPPKPMYTPKERKQLEDWLKLGPPYREIAAMALAAEPPATDVKN